MPPGLEDMVGGKRKRKSPRKLQNFMKWFAMACECCSMSHGIRLGSRGKGQLSPTGGPQQDTSEVALEVTALHGVCGGGRGVGAAVLGGFSSGIPVLLVGMGTFGCWELQPSGSSR